MSENMAKITLEKKVNLHIMLDQETDKLLTKTAYEERKTKTQIIEEALKAYFEKLEKEEKEKEKK